MLAARLGLKRPGLRPEMGGEAAALPCPGALGVSVVRVSRDGLKGGYSLI